MIASRASHTDMRVSQGVHSMEEMCGKMPGIAETVIMEINKRMTKLLIVLAQCIRN